MATSFVTGTFTGSSSQINLTFGYLDKTHVYVYLNGVLKTVGSDYVWNSDAQIQILGGNPAAGTVFLAQRRTPSELLATFAPGNLDSTDLNFSFLQAIYIANEAQDAIGQKWSTLEGGTGKTIQAIGTTSGNILVYDASGNVIDSGTNISAIAAVAGNAALALQYRNEAQGFRNEASNYAVSASGYATQSMTYRDASQTYSLTAQAYAVSMSLINGTDYSAKYWAQQAYLAGGVPIGAIEQVYGNGTTIPPGYLKVIPGLEITPAYPEFRAWAIANGWAVNGSGNPVFPSTDDALFLRQWRSGQTLRDAGRTFGSVQADAMQGHKHAAVGGNFFIQGASGTSYTGGGGTAGVDPNTGLPSSDGTNGTPRTALETRVANITVTWFIKAYNAPVDTATVAAAQVLADLADARARLTAAEAKIVWEKIAVVDFTAQTQLIQTDLGAYRELRVTLEVVGNGTQVTMQVSANNGSTWLAGGTDYTAIGVYSQSGSTTTSGFTVTGSAFGWFANNILAGGRPSIETVTFGQFNKPAEMQGTGSASWISGSQYFTSAVSMNYAPATALNALKMVFSTAISGRLIIEGVKG